MRVFVTGASGFIGQAIVRKLLTAGHAVVAFRLPQEPERLAGGASIVRGDVTRAETLSGAMAGVDAVVHVAGSVGFQPWRECIAINREGARNVAGEAVRAGVRRFIHLSSVAVYGRIPEVPIREDSPLKKIGDPYGDTKIDAENILQEQARQGKLDLTIIRPTVVYGPGDNKFLPSLLGNLRREGFRIIGDGTQSVDLVHVDDVAACVLRVLQEPRTIRKAYNLTNPENPSWNEMIRMVCSEAGLPMPRGHLPFRTAFLLAGVMELLSRLSGKPPRLNRYTLRVVGRPYRYLTDAAQRDLGFAPSIGLLDGLRQCLKATRERDDTAEAPLLVIGAGAIGGVLGGLLARAGRRVAFLVRGEEAARRIRADGLKVSGVRGAFTVRVEASHRPGDLAGPFGLVLVAVKAYDLAAALRPALGLVAPAGLVVSLQNGAAIEDLEALAGADRAVGCMVGWGATLHPDGTAELTSEGSLVIGSRSPRAQARLEPLRAALGAAFPTAVSADILADLYSKLIVNSCITSLGALSGRNLGWMLARRRYRVAFIGIIREAMAVADALGIRVPAYAGRLDYYAFLRGQGPLDGWRRHLFIRLMGLKYRRLKSSSLQSLERKRPTEVDWFNGWISRKGRERGVPTPLNDRLTAMIHEIESGARPISPRNLEGSLPGLL